VEGTADLKGEDTAGATFFGEDGGGFEGFEGAAYDDLTGGVEVGDVDACGFAELGEGIVGEANDSGHAGGLADGGCGCLHQLAALGDKTEGIVEAKAFSGDKG
jgi:hypothetical protein